MSLVSVRDYACTGCGVCVESCPVDVLRLDSATHKAVPLYAEDCQACFLCAIDCPRDAIDVRGGEGDYSARALRPKELGIARPRS
jgi:NAD-dependent dihydropyrimidine dehydrogenase PreA subunit